jgi:hypothetical protein
MPAYFLYFHTLELTLKALLLHSAARNRTSHTLKKLFADCQTHGFVVPRTLELPNLVNLLEQANADQALRYRKVGPAVYPKLIWTHDAVTEILKSVEAIVQPGGIVPGPATHFVFTVPEPTRQ